MHGVLKHIPGVLYHVQVWRLRWPVHNSDVVGLFVGGDDSGTMAGVAIQEDEVFRWVSFLEGYHDVTQNFIPVLGSVHVAFNDPQGDFMVVSANAHTMMDLTPCDVTALTQSSV